MQKIPMRQKIKQWDKKHAEKVVVTHQVLTKKQKYLFQVKKKKSIKSPKNKNLSIRPLLKIHTKFLLIFKKGLNK